MSPLNKFICVTMFFVIGSFWLYVMLIFDVFNLDKEALLIVKQRNKHKDQHSEIDYSIPIRHPYTIGSFVARVKRKADDNLEIFSLSSAGNAKSSRQIHFTPPLRNINSPKFMNLNQMASHQGFIPVDNMQHSAMSFLPAFLPYQQRRLGSADAPIVQPVCFLSQENPTSPNAPTFYCTYIPVMPIRYQLPEVLGVADFRRTAADSTKTGDKHDELLQKSALKSSAYLLRKARVRACSFNFIQCGDGSKCIPKYQWCDGTVHCADVSDETKCSCRERVGQQKLCDDYQDCPRGEDELGCFGCPSNSFSCSDSTSLSGNKVKCISPSNRCDGIEQCSNGKDEENCNILTKTSNFGNELYPVGYADGFLHRNYKGKWYPVCGYAHTWAKQACLMELGSLSEEPQLEMVRTPNQHLLGPYLVEESAGSIIVPECENQMTYVQCPHPGTGQRIMRPWTSEAFLGKSAKEASEGPMVSIVGGHPSPPGAWPFIVSITKDGNFHCGGAILNEWWVLSAAHCFSDSQRHYYEVEAGMLRRLSFSPTQQTRKVAGVVVHSDYDPFVLTNDISLLALAEPLLLNSWVFPARLPDVEFGRERLPEPGSVCIAVGWGALTEGGSDPDHLREVEVPIVSCKHLEDKNSAEVCAGVRQGGRDACQGDSGGPLMCSFSNSDSNWYIGGVVSHGIGCGRRNEPGAYTKVSHFIDWINTIINSREAPPMGFHRSRSECPGFSCNQPHARCISSRRRCDRNADCLKAEDEINCPLFGGFQGILNQLFGRR